MKTYFIVFNHPANKETITERIKKYPGWARINDNAWFVRTKGKAADVRDELASIDQSVSLLVLNSTNIEWGTMGIDKQVTQWMHEAI